MQVWSVVALPDGSGFVSCSADHSIKFWEWEILTGGPGPPGQEGAPGGPRRLSARHVRTLKMADDVLCVRVSPDGRLIAAALLDSTIQVDTFSVPHHINLACQLPPVAPAQTVTQAFRPSHVGKGNSCTTLKALPTLLCFILQA